MNIFSRFSVLGLRAAAVAGLIALSPVVAWADHPSDEAEESFPVLTTVVRDRTGDLPDPPEGKVTLRLSLAYSPTHLPGDGLAFYEPDPEVNSLWAMESLEAGEEVPVLDQIDDGVLFMDPGEERMVTVVYRNPSDHEVGFVTLPHQDSPSYLAHFAKLTCYCLSFVYKTPAEGSWYRVIRVALNPDTPPGSKIDALFTILTDPAQFPPAGT